MIPYILKQLDFASRYTTERKWSHVLDALSRAKDAANAERIRDLDRSREPLDPFIQSLLDLDGMPNR
jgi:hypothetical protein